MANKRMLIDAAKKFINKVKTGRARSTVTFNELSLALQTEEDDGIEDRYNQEIKED